MYSLKKLDSVLSLLQLALFIGITFLIVSIRSMTISNKLIKVEPAKALRI